MEVVSKIEKRRKKREGTPNAPLLYVTRYIGRNKGCLKKGRASPWMRRPGLLRGKKLVLVTEPTGPLYLAQTLGRGAKESREEKVWSVDCNRRGSVERDRERKKDQPLLREEQQ